MRLTSPPDAAAIVLVWFLERRGSGRVKALRHGSPRRRRPLGALVVDESLVRRCASRHSHRGSAGGFGGKSRRCRLTLVALPSDVLLPLAIGRGHRSAPDERVRYLTARATGEASLAPKRTSSFLITPLPHRPSSALSVFIKAPRD